MAGEKETIVKVERVSKEFEGKGVLRDVSVDIKEGEALGLLGKSGSGKSILLHMIRGSKEYAPTSGRVIYRVAVCPSCLDVQAPSKAGKQCEKCEDKYELRVIDYWSESDKDLRRALRRRIAIMLQRTFGLYSEETVIFNVMQALEARGYPAGKRLRRAYELLKAVDMLHRVTFPARDLSGGEKQRVVLARQLALDPVILLADEPTGTLDPETAKLVHRSLKRVSESGMTMLVTSHWPSVIKELAQKAIWLDHGEVVEYGDAADVVAHFEEQVGEIGREKEVKVGEPKIRVVHCKKYYYSLHRGIVKAVDDVSFEVREGEIFGLLGKSGAGKTSLARIIAGIDALTGGSVLVRSGDRWIDVGRQAEKGTVWISWAATTPGRGEVLSHVAMLHQEYSLYAGKTVLENLTSCIGLRMPEELARMKAKFILTGVGFTEEEAEEILPKTHNELSVGERQRVALAQVLMKEPDIAILDEPTGTMDPITKKYVATTIRAARENLGVTFLIVTHDVDFAYDVCDRIAHMKDGKIVKIEDLRAS